VYIKQKIKVPLALEIRNAVSIYIPVKNAFKVQLGKQSAQRKPCLNATLRPTKSNFELLGLEPGPPQ
jgi:hypothetical protein